MSSIANRERSITASEARVLTDQIQVAAGQLWRLLLEAYELRAWEALGYASWREYAKNEFAFSQGHLYRLLDQGKVLRAIEQAAGSPIGEIRESVCREIKPQLQLVTSHIADRVESGEDPAAAVDQAIALVRVQRPDQKYLMSRKRVEAPNRFVANLVLGIDANLDGVDRIDIAQLDPSCFPDWSQALRRAARLMVKFAGRLERQR
jgi:hypothetical protein